MTDEVVCTSVVVTLWGVAVHTWQSDQTAPDVMRSPIDSPSKSGDEHAHHQGADQASNGEDGHSE